MKKVFWVSRHQLSPAQKQAISDLHGSDCQIEHLTIQFDSMLGLAEFISTHPRDIIYAVAGAPHYLAAALSGLKFGVFENHPQKRQDGVFGLKSVYWVRNYEIREVWRNSNPLSDNGEMLMPVRQ